MNRDVSGGRVAASLLLLSLAACNVPLTVVDQQRSDAGCAGCCPCTDPSSCCTPSEQVCGASVGPDGGGGPVCICERLWSCDRTGERCERSLIDSLPGSVWSCQLAGASVVCSAPGDAGEPPPPVGERVPASWSCTHDAATATWRCERKAAANPCNSEAGATEWSCSVESSHLVCDRR